MGEEEEEGEEWLWHQMGSSSPPPGKRPVLCPKWLAFLQGASIPGTATVTPSNQIDIPILSWEQVLWTLLLSKHG